MLVTEIKGCRVCGGDRLQSVLDLGSLAISDFVDEPWPDPDRAPLELIACADCGLVQLRHTVERDRLYRDYHYRSGTNETMVAELRGIVEYAQRFAPLRIGDAVLDIGANDGTLLRQYPDSVYRIGVEPSQTFGDVHAASLWIRDYWPLRTATPEPCRIITSIACMYDLDDPRAFFEGVKEWLAPDGVWVTQFQDLHAMLAVTGFDNICHEHLEYYSMAPILWLCKRVGFRVVDATYNATNGGSLRLALMHAPAKPIQNAGMDFSNLLGQMFHFRKRVADRKDAINRLLDDALAAGRCVAGYGASTKGNTTLQYCGIGPDRLPLIADRQPAKWGKFTAGSNIPIISEDDARAVASDFLVLPWHFLDAFVARESQFLARGGRFIVPLPEARVVGGVTDASLQPAAT